MSAAVPHDGASGPQPYADHAHTYRACGWAPLPLPPRAKKPVPNGYTGSAGAWPSGPDVQAWIEDHPGGNIALRLPPNVIGVDIDAYGTKAGRATLEQLEHDHGTLPDTWRSTSRDDGTSGIRFYTIPEGLRWPGILGPGIEVIRHGHRYAVAWPSTHPDTGGTYRWVTPSGTTSLHDIPNPATLPALPTPWVEHFTAGRTAEVMDRADLSGPAAKTWLSSRRQGPPCAHMSAALTQGMAGLTNTPGSRHEAALTLTNRIIWLSGQGHTGVSPALTHVRKAFTAVTAGDRSREEADGEWYRMISGAVNLASIAHPEIPPADPCTDPYSRFHPPALQEPPQWVTEQPGPSDERYATSVPPGTHGSTAAQTSTDAPAGTAAAPNEPPDDELDPDRERSTWWPVDIENALTGPPEPPPTHLVRTDGHALLYTGKINGIIGPSESGKTWVALVAIVQAVHDGENVTFIDFEDTDSGVIGRLLSLGLTADQIRTHVAYMSPEAALDLLSDIDLREHLETWAPALVVLDGFNAAMTLHGLDLMSNKESTTFFQLVLAKLKAHGATVAYVDHTPKDKNNESSGGIGAQAKRAMTPGAILRAHPVKEFGRGQKGTIRLYVDKDRPGHVRGQSTPHKVGERSMMWAGDLTLQPVDDDHPDQISVTLDSPETVATGRTEFRPTTLMGRVSDYLAATPGAGRNAIIRGVTGNDKGVEAARLKLIEEGWVTVKREGQSTPHTLVQPFEESVQPPSHNPQNQPGANRGPTGGQAPGQATGGHRLPSGGTESPYVGAPSWTPNEAPNDQPGAKAPSTAQRVVGGQQVTVDLNTGEVIDP